MGFRWDFEANQRPTEVLKLGKASDKRRWPWGEAWSSKSTAFMQATGPTRKLHCEADQRLRSARRRSAAKLVSGLSLIGPWLVSVQPQPGEEKP